MLTETNHCKVMYNIVKTSENTFKFDEKIPKINKTVVPSDDNTGCTVTSGLICFGKAKIHKLVCFGIHAYQNI
jgi:hypothetical protein